MKTVAIFILSLPLLFLAIAWFCLAAPLMMIFVLPLWGLLDLIEVLRGRKSLLLKGVVAIFLMGFEMYGHTTGFFKLDLI